MDIELEQNEVKIYEGCDMEKEFGKSKTLLQGKHYNLNIVGLSIGPRTVTTFSYSNKKRLDIINSSSKKIFVCLEKLPKNKKEHIFENQNYVDAVQKKTSPHTQWTTDMDYIDITTYDEWDKKKTFGKITSVLPYIGGIIVLILLIILGFVIFYTIRHYRAVRATGQGTLRDKKG